MNPRTPLLPRMAVAVILAAITFPACYRPGLHGNGHRTTETRTLTEFHNISGSGACEIEWKPGAPSVSITTDSNLLAHIRTDVEGDKLHIDSDEQLAPSHSIKVKVNSASLSGVKFSGAVRFEAMNLAGANFYLDTEGAAKVFLGGTVTTLTASMSGASRLTADSLHTQTTEISLSGAGTASVWASERLRAAIQGAGKVSYSGNPKNVQKDIAGAGKISQKDLEPNE